MNERLLAILQLVVAGLAIADPTSQAAQMAKIIGASVTAYKEMTGKAVDEELIKEFQRIT